MNTIKYISFINAIIFLASCQGNGDQPDAYGNFETEEVTISAQLPGEIVELNIEEGTHIGKQQVVGQIDTTELHLSKLEIKANRAMIQSQFTNLTAEIDVLKAEKDNVERELARMENLLKNKAATPQAFDDLQGKLEVILKKIATVNAKNPSVFAQVEAIDAKLAQIEERIKKAKIVNPFDGTVLTKIASEHEFVGPGAPIYQVADLSYLILRAYIDGSQLTSVKIGQQVTVKTDGPEGELSETSGRIVWVSDQAEFTPKIIQTREERTDLVYAVKIRVENNGSLKSGMPGEVYFDQHNDATDQ